MTADHDYDDILRRVLHAAVDPIEPAGDGLERIRHRLAAPWIVRQTSLMLTECADLFQLIVIRLEPAVTRMRSAIASWCAAHGLTPAHLWARGSALAATGFAWARGLRRPDPAHLSRPGAPDPDEPAGTAEPPGSWQARFRPAMAWLRPAFAVAGAVVIVVAGVLALGQLRETINPISAITGAGGQPAQSLNAPNSGGGQSPLSTGNSQPASSPNQSASPSSHSSSPTPTCSASALPSASPTAATPTPSTSPSGSGSPSSSPSQSASSTPSASPSDTTSQPTSGPAASSGPATSAAAATHLGAGTSKSSTSQCSSSASASPSVSVRPAAR